MLPAPGPYFFHTQHSGEECDSAVHYYTVEPYTINSCIPPDAANPSYYRMSCKKSDVGPAKYSIIKTTYAADDSTCSGTPRSGPIVFSHALACKPAPYGAAGFRYSDCGDLPTPLVSRAQVLVKSFPQAPRSHKLLRKAEMTAVVCQGLKVVTRAYVLGVCMPFKQGSGFEEDVNRIGESVSYHRKLALVSVSASTIVLSETRYRVADSRCQEAQYDIVQHVFSTNTNSATARCVQDPLDSTMAYMQAKYYDGNSATRGAQLDAFLRDAMVPTAVPTARPTSI